MSISRRGFLKALFIGASVAFTRPKLALAGDLPVGDTGPYSAAEELQRLTGKDVYLYTVGQSNWTYMALD